MNERSDQTSRLLQGHYGGAVSGDQFWPRPEVVDNLVETLKAGESVSLFGLRRIGKSSAMKEAARIIELDAKAHIIVEIDAQDFNALDKLLTEILLKLPTDGALFDNLKKKLVANRFLPEGLKKGFELLFKNKGGGDSELAKHLPSFWQPVCNEITAAIKESGVQLILMIDEFPYMCKNLLAHEGGRDFVDTLLATFRQWRAGPITMVISGSIGMKFLIREYQLEFVHFNDCISIDIHPLTQRAEAQEMVNALVANSTAKGWLPETTETLLDEVAAFYPSFIQYAFSRIKAARAFGGEQVEDLFAEQIRPAWDVTFFAQFDGRLKIYDVPLRDLSRVVFAQIAADDGLVNREAFDEVVDLDETLQILKEDGFLACRVARDGSECWRLSSPLVSIWWQQRGKKNRNLAAKKNNKGLNQ
ncbi:MAG: hypothetical protein ACI8WB_001062 [Phenylobacterium sp.]|jgi:hypothetical protein